MSKIVLATGNAGKVKEMASQLENFGFNVISQSEFNITEAEETGSTFIENAIIKARHAAKETGLPALADDSGLEVDYLKGAPGVYSARYAGSEKGDKANIQKLLENMKNAPDDKRQARFHCVLVYMLHENDPAPLVCHGVFEGTITREASGTLGFGYDPIFFVKERGCTAAHLEPHVKNQISHRAQALEKLFSALREEKK